jgi:hypothetical protein
MALAKGLRDLFALFAAHHVEFIVVGAHAMAFHGKPRYTGDLDLFVRPSSENAGRILGALEAFGFGGLDIRIEDLTSPGAVLQLGVEPNLVDILTGLTGVGFDQAWSDRSEGALDGLPVAYLGRASLIANKRATGRKQDLADLETLGAE